MIKKRLIGLLPHAGKHIIYHILLQILALIAQIVLVFTLANVIEEAVGGVLDRDAILIAIITFVVVYIIRVSCEELEAKESYLASVDVKRVIREKIYDKLLRLGAGYREKVSTSQVVQLSSEGVEQLETYFGRYLPQFAYSMSAPLILFVVLAIRVNFAVSLVLLLLVPLIPVSIVAVMKIAGKLFRKYWGVYSELGDTFLENLQGLTTIKIYRADERKAAEMDVEASHFRKITMRVLTMQLISTTVMDVMAYGGAAVGMLVGIGYYMKGEISLSGMLVVILLASEFFLPLRMLGSYFHIAMNGMSASDKIFELLDTEEGNRGTEKLEEGTPVISLYDVDFAYDEDREILKNINMLFPKGSFTSIIGESGCGKSTVVGIISGRNKGYSGSIKIGTKELRDVDEASLLKKVTLVKSNGYIFKGSVAENLRMADKDAAPERLWEVLRQVRLDELFKERDGLDTLISEKAGNLSGGQAQRLALARALLSKSEVMIFDEVTSNIDAESEEMIMEVIKGLAGKRTVIMISHRLYNVIESDNIYLMDRGKIAESGTHEELIARNGKYAKLFNSQTALEAYAKKKELRPNIRKSAATDILEEDEEEAGYKEAKEGRRSGIAIMGKLIVLIKPLLHIMALAILLGAAGYLCAISLTILGAKAIGLASGGFLSGASEYLSKNAGVSSTIGKIMAAMICVAVFRGVFHYIEQYCNHFIAFKLLAAIRHKVFAALRKLCPAKLEGRDKGNLISIITTDIELLEVFYAHTISPIVIAAVVSLIMTIFIGSYSVAAGILALTAYIVIGIVIPVINGRRGGTLGMKFRNSVGELSSFVLGELRGIDETIQYGAGEKKKKAIYDKSVKLAKIQEELAEAEGRQRSFTNGAIQLFSYGMLFLTLILYSNGIIEFEAVVISTVAMMSSFGPVVALSALSNNLNQTLASGERVLALLEEEPEAAEVEKGKDSISLKEFTGVKAKEVNFSYGDRKILEDFTLDIRKGKILGIHGASGSGKSTFLKLLMRFWETDSGEILISDKNIKKIVTEDLRRLEGYVTQETHLFTGTIAENIAFGKPEAKLSEIREAAKAASIDEFILGLPKGYDTKVGELGDTLSSGEKQRLGLARAFLCNPPFILLDEPTSNLDSLNEAMILKAIKEKSKGKTILLVSHRDSTMNIVDEMVEMSV